MKVKKMFPVGLGPIGAPLVWLIWSSCWSEKESCSLTLLHSCIYIFIQSELQYVRRSLEQLQNRSNKVQFRWSISCLQPWTSSPMVNRPSQPIGHRPCLSSKNQQTQFRVSTRSSFFFFYTCPLSTREPHIKHSSSQAIALKEQMRRGLLLMWKCQRRFPVARAWARSPPQRLKSSTSLTQASSPPRATG